MDIRTFRKTVMAYYRVEGRHDMLWRHTRDPYRILVSEIMLQQTQVARVTPFYTRFIKKFSDFAALAGAAPREVLAVWQGLGYNRRALNLQRTAKAVMALHNGKLPRTPEALATLPGIGKATAGSIAAFAFDAPVPFIETNIRRVFIRFFFPKRRAVRDEELMPLVVRALPARHAREWYYALMDYGAMLAAREKENPNARSAHYRKQPKFAGSRRELRGMILKEILKGSCLTPRALVKRLKKPEADVREALLALTNEGFVSRGSKGGFRAL